MAGEKRRKTASGRVAAVREGSATEVATRPDVVAALEAQRARAVPAPAPAAVTVIAPAGAAPRKLTLALKKPQTIRGFYYDPTVGRYFPGDTLPGLPEAEEKAAPRPVPTLARSVRATLPARGLNRRGIRAGPRLSMLGYLKAGGAQTASRGDLWRAALAQARHGSREVALEGDGLSGNGEDGLLQTGAENRWILAHPNDPWRISVVQYSSDRYFSVKELRPRDEAEAYTSEVSLSQPQRCEQCGDILGSYFLGPAAPLDDAVLAMVRCKPGVYVKLELFEAPQEGLRPLRTPTRTMLRDPATYLACDLRYDTPNADGEQGARTFVGGEQGAFRVDDFLLAANCVLSHTPVAHASLPGVNSDILAVAALPCEDSDRVVLGLRNGTVLVVAVDPTGTVHMLGDLGQAAAAPMARLSIAATYPHAILATDLFGGVTAFRSMDLALPLAELSAGLETPAQRCLVEPGRALLREAPRTFLVQGTDMLRAALGAQSFVAVASDHAFQIFSLPEQKLVLSRGLQPEDARPVLELAEDPERMEGGEATREGPPVSGAAFRFLSMASDGALTVEEYGNLVSS